MTRVPILSYGVRAYLDVPYLMFVLGALLVEVRRPRAGAPVLALLALAGLLRPEAWVFSGLYWLYMLDLVPAAVRAHLPPGERPQGRRELALLTALTGVAPLIWLGSDLLVTGNPLWSLTNTRHTASVLDRETGIAEVPEWIPRRIGEILRPPVLLGAAIGGVLALRWTMRRAMPGALVGVLAVIVFAAFAAVGLPINTPLRVPRLGDPVHLLRRRGVRLDGARARGPASAHLDGAWRRHRRRAARLCARPVPRGQP